ncbi:MAG: hypothetical protein ACPGQL_05855 [Thermoplasmatota archaeon]
MMHKSILLSALLAATVLAGCSDGPASGEFASTSPSISIDGSAELEYVEASSTYPGSDPQLEAIYDCSLDQLTGTVGQGPICTPASSMISVHMHSLPNPDANGYTLYLVNSTGDEMNLGNLADGGAGMYTFTADESTYYGDWEEMVIRMGTIPVASAPNMSGNQTFAVNSGLLGASVSGTWSGKTLTVNAGGLYDHPDASFIGWLVTVDEETGMKTHVEQFSMGPGETVYEASEDIEDYQEFHVHLGGSDINLGITQL